MRSKPDRELTGASSAVAAGWLDNLAKPSHAAFAWRLRWAGLHLVVRDRTQSRLRTRVPQSGRHEVNVYLST